MCFLQVTAIIANQARSEENHDNKAQVDIALESADDDAAYEA